MEYDIILCGISTFIDCASVCDMGGGVFFYYLIIFK